MHACFGIASVLDVHIYRERYICQFFLSLFLSLYIRRPLQSVERVRLHLLAYNIQSLSISHPSQQGQKRTSGQPAQVARQLKSSPPGTQAAGIQDLGARRVGFLDFRCLATLAGWTDVLFWALLRWGELERDWML